MFLSDTAGGSFFPGGNSQVSRLFLLTLDNNDNIDGDDDSKYDGKKWLREQRKKIARSSLRIEAQVSPETNARIVWRHSGLR